MPKTPKSDPDGDTDSDLRKPKDAATVALMSFHTAFDPTTGVHPETWKEEALEQGMSLREFRKGKRELEKSGEVQYHFGESYDDSYYYFTKPLEDWEGV